MLVPCFGGFAVATQTVAAFVGRTGHYNISGATEPNYQLAFTGGEWSGGTPQAGDLCFLTLHTNSGTGNVTLPTGFTSGGGSIAAASTAVGENYHLQFGQKVLDGTDITNGYIELTGINVLIQRPSGLVIFRDATSIIQASPNFNRSTSFTANSVSITRPTSTKAGVALSVTHRGHGSRTCTPPAGFTNRGDITGAGTSAAVYAMHYATKDLSGPGQIDAGTVSFSGDADMTITNATFVIE